MYLHTRNAHTSSSDDRVINLFANRLTETMECYYKIYINIFIAHSDSDARFKCTYNGNKYMHKVAHGVHRTIVTVAHITHEASIIIIVLWH